MAKKKSVQSCPRSLEADVHIVPFRSVAIKVRSVHSRMHLGYSAIPNRIYPNAWLQQGKFLRRSLLVMPSESGGLWRGGLLTISFENLQRDTVSVSSQQVATDPKI